MNTREFLVHLRQLDIQLSIRDGKLKLNAPKGVLTAELKAELVVRKDDILTLLQPDKINTSELPAPGSIPRPEYMPLSISQEQICSLVRVSPQSAAYTIYQAYRLHGSLNIEDLSESVAELFRRHESLRTSFPFQENNARCQQISPPESFGLQFVDQRTTELAKKPGRLDEAILSEIDQPFDLENGPLARLILWQLGDEDYLFLLLLHHSIGDGWSCTILCRELETAYQSRQGTQSEPLSRLPVLQYADYTLWQHEWLKSNICKAQREYWQTQFADAVSVPRLPFESSQPRTQVDWERHADRLYHAATVPITISKHQTTSLYKLAEEEEATLFVVLMGVFQLLLQRYSSQNQIAICTPVVNRTEPAWVNTVGYFNNTVLIQTDFTDAQNFREVVCRVRDRTLEAFANQEFPYSQVAEFPKLVRQPLSRFMFALEQTLNQDLRLPGITATPIQLTNNVAQNDLALFLHEEDGLVGHFMYRTERFNAGTVEELASNFSELINILLLDLEQLISNLPEFSQSQTSPENSPDYNIDGHPYIPPRTETEQKLATIWQEVFGIERVGVQDNFFALGGHSLLAIRLFSQIEESFGRTLPATILSQAGTIEQLVEVLQKDKPTQLVPVVKIQTKGTKRPFFYISPPGEAMLSFVYLVHHLESDRPYYGLQPLGINGETAHYTQTEDIAARFIQEIRAIQPKGPYILGGACYGGLVAVELARQLQVMDETVSLLALFDTPFPNPTLSSKIQWHLQSLMKLSPKEMAEYVLERAKRRGANLIGKFQLSRGQEIPKQLDELFVKAKIAQESNNYIPDHYHGKIILYRAEADAPAGDDPNFAGGWNKIATEGVDVHLVPGNHDTIMSEPHVSVLAQEFQRCLDLVQAEA
ncbi:hypothetical protein KFU94_33180 [Chloroflexi bacterium TSY]|nr:hypothetical protein [Chloroflexi bacterium TSY]